LKVILVIFGILKGMHATVFFRYTHFLR